MVGFARETMLEQQKELTAEAQGKWRQISDQIEVIWDEILEVANTVLQAHAKFGFSEFADKINPSLEDILLSLKVVESALDTVYATGTLEYSEERKVQNAKQQIWLVQSIGAALKHGNEADYESAMEKLGNQARH